MADEPSAVITAEEGGYTLTFNYHFSGDVSDDEGHRVVDTFKETWEQTRLILQTLGLIGFEVTPGQRLMERNGSNSWRQSAPLLPSPVPVTAEVAPVEAPAVSAVKELMGAGVKEPAEEPAEDPILKAAVQGKDPFLNKPLAAAITRATPPDKRPSLARALGSSAEAIYLWLLEQAKKDPRAVYTVGEIGKATSHSDYVTASRLKDLEGAGLVIKGSKEGTGKHKRWATFRAVAEEPAEKRRNPVAA